MILGPFWPLGADNDTQVPLIGILMPLMSNFYRFLFNVASLFVKFRDLCQDVVPDWVLPKVHSGKGSVPRYQGTNLGPTILENQFEVGPGTNTIQNSINVLIQVGSLKMHSQGHPKSREADGPVLRAASTIMTRK